MSQVLHPASKMLVYRSQALSESARGVLSALLTQCGAVQVISVYERFVDHDDIDGFMSALGYDGFVGPTEAEDLEGAFVSARYACRPEAFHGRSEPEQAKGRATLELLEAWQAAWQAAMSEA